VDSWHSYPSIYTLGHSAIADLLRGPVQVEEKIDGSQFSFGVSEEVVAGDEGRGYQRVIHVRSKGAVLHPDAPEKMFEKAVETVKRLAPELRPGWTYRGEYLLKPRHNGLAYDRIPAQHIILFDINSGHEVYLSQEDKRAEAARLGLEVTPLLHVGIVPDIAAFRAFLETESVLGGQLIEGVVVKPLNYDKFGKDKKALMGKFVSEAFKEVQSKAWRIDNPGRQDILDSLIATYTSQARWQKAVQHLRERGLIEDTPRDIGKLMKEVPADIEKECRDEIAFALFQWAWPKVCRSVVRGLPDWYKNELLKRQFDQEGVA
jgi:hypothetical protein